jgi:hypothetical protein
MFHESGAMGMRFGTRQGPASFMGDSAQDRGFPAGPGTHIKPISAIALGSSESKCDQLTSFVLHSCATITHTVQCIGHAINECGSQW